MRAAVPERDAEALRRADGDVRAKLRGRRQRRQREEVGGDGELRARRRRLLGEGLVVDDGAVGRGVLHERAAHVVAEGEGGVVAGDDLDAIKDSTEALMNASQEFSQRLYEAAAAEAQTNAPADDAPADDDDVIDAEIVDDEDAS